MNEPLDAKHVENESMLEENNSAASLLEIEERETVVSNNKRTISELVNNEIQAENIPSEKESINSGNEDVSDSSKQSLTENALAVVVDKLTKTQIVGRLEKIVSLPVTESVKLEVDTLKQAFYKLKKTEIEETKRVSQSSEEEPNNSSSEVVEKIEEKLKELLQAFKEKKSVLTAEAEKMKEENLLLKKKVIEKIATLAGSQDDFYKVYNEFRKLQQEWKEIKDIPQVSVNDIWKEYQLYCEKFYDLLKINNEMRDYDFKKNLEHKTALCESVEKLENGNDVVSAFYQLQKFHQDWREIGPVARELREETWIRFKNASTVINKKHQDYFELLRNLEERNLEEKTAICEEMEAIDYTAFVNFKDWDEKNKRVLELQEKWKTIGFAPKKSNVKIFERFRTSCDLFFQKKSEFYKDIKETMDVNLEKKKALCEKAEALKDNEDWKESTDKLIALQKEWKTIGTVSRKHSDAIWKRFISACDYFFEQKNKHFSSQKSEETENLKVKKELIEKINAIDASLNSQEAILVIRELMSEWNNVGFVPFREKDKIYQQYREAVDKHFDRLKVDESERRLQSFKSNLTEIASGDKPKNKLLGEREKLMRTYERLKNDIQTYENNIGFLSVSSKGGGGLVKDMTRKIESLKEELGLIVKKIGVIDENLG